MAQVCLLYHTPEPERAIATAARLCYAKVGAEELLQEMDEASIRRVLDTIISSGHLSALEHAAYTFAIEKVSRAMTHQLVRHRLASYNQQSQRYVEITDKPYFITPPAFADNERVSKRYQMAIMAAWSAYRDLIKLGMNAEDARYILPNATETKIVVTMNVRELLHFFELRCCNRAQWEIREVAEMMLSVARPTAPFIFKDAGPNCIRRGCTEGKLSCGKPKAKYLG